MALLATPITNIILSEQDISGHKLKSKLFGHTQKWNGRNRKNNIFFFIQSLEFLFSFDSSFFIYILHKVWWINTGSFKF